MSHFIFATESYHVILNVAERSEESLSVFATITSILGYGCRDSSLRSEWHGSQCH